MDDYQTILASLERQYPGRMMVGVEEVATIFDCSVKTIYNGTHRKAKNKFPVQPVAGKKFRLTDIARAIVGM